MQKQNRKAGGLAKFIREVTRLVLADGGTEKKGRKTMTGREIIRRFVAGFREFEGHLGECGVCKSATYHSGFELCREGKLIALRIASLGAKEEKQ